MHSNFIKIGLSSCALLAAFAATGAQAGTATDAFEVNLKIEAACSVTTGDAARVDFGTVDSTATDLESKSSITVRCSNTTPYYVGLLPSNDNKEGAGDLNPGGSSPDKVPYQLRSESGMRGQIWGNTASSSDVGNGVAGKGTGADEQLTVYATVLDANYAPDKYYDKVRVTVNF